MYDVFFYVVQENYKFICSIRVPEDNFDYKSDIRNKQIKLKLIINGRFFNALV